MSSDHARRGHEVPALEVEGADPLESRIHAAVQAFQHNLEEAGLGEHVSGLLLRHSLLQQGVQGQERMQMRWMAAKARGDRIALVCYSR